MNKWSNKAIRSLLMGEWFLFAVALVLLFVMTSCSGPDSEALPPSPEELLKSVKPAPISGVRNVSQAVDTMAQATGISRTDSSLVNPIAALEKAASPDGGQKVSAIMLKAFMDLAGGFCQAAINRENGFPVTDGRRLLFLGIDLNRNARAGTPAAITFTDAELSMWAKNILLRFRGELPVESEKQEVVDGVKEFLMKTTSAGSDGTRAAFQYACVLAANGRGGLLK